jgi:hypothetical protein
MNKYLILLFSVGLLLFSSCNKETTKTWTVQYKLLNLAGEIPTYRVTYLLQNGGAKSVGPINTYNWESEELLEFGSGQPVSLQIEIISGNGSYELLILRNGATHEKQIMPSNSNSFKIESEI